MSSPALTFAVYRGSALQGRTTVSQSVIKVGNDSRSHLRLHDAAASRMHAVIEAGAADTLTLIDLGNEPGTFVNGARVDKCRLHVGDRIQVGETELVLETAGAAALDPAVTAQAATSAFTASANPFTAASFALDTLNPFASGARRAAEAEALHVPDDALPGTYSYSLMKSGPEVAAELVEESEIEAVEIMILWGNNVLHVAHLSPPRSYYVGEEQHANLSSDFLLPSAAIGVGRMPLVIATPNGGIHVVLPAAASGSIELPNRPRMSIDEARTLATPSAELAQTHELGLVKGGKARIEFNGFTFQIGVVNAGKPMPRALASALDQGIAGSFAASLLATALTIGALAFFVPPLGLSDDSMPDEDRLYAIQQYMEGLAERERENQKDDAAPEAQKDDEGGTGTRAKNEEGQMGNPTVRSTGKSWSVKGPKDNPDIRLSQQMTVAEARDFGIIGLLNAGAVGDPNAPTVPWGGHDALGKDAESHRGNMWGDPGEAWGVGGLGLSGIGEGGGGRGEGIGLGNIGTYGHGAGLGPGQGFGNSVGRLASGHNARVPRVRPEGVTSVSGRLPPEVIQRIVRQNYGRFRMCYEQGLARNPNLQGRVVARFVIGSDGAVAATQNGGSDLPDSGVVSCVVSSFYGLSFPTPEGGTVRVVYPIMFSPG